MSKIENTIGKATSVSEVLGLAVGAGSSCWENLEGTGLFQEQQASAVVRSALSRIIELREAATMQQHVQEFHTAMGQPVGNSPHALPLDRVPVRVELIREEFMDELIPALLSGDIVETVDAAIDILYVTFGLLVEMGVDAQPVFDGVQASNMSKFGADGKPIIAGPNDPDGIFEGRVKKGPNYFRPNIAQLLREQGWDGIDGLGARPGEPS